MTRRVLRYSTRSRCGWQHDNTTVQGSVLARPSSQLRNWPLLLSRRSQSAADNRVARLRALVQSRVDLYVCFVSVSPESSKRPATQASSISMNSYRWSTPSASMCSWLSLTIWTTASKVRVLRPVKFSYTPSRERDASNASQTSLRRKGSKSSAARRLD